MVNPTMHIIASYVPSITYGIVNRFRLPHIDRLFEWPHRVMVLCVHSGVTLVTLGTPYWHYRTYRLYIPEESLDDGSLEQWPRLIEGIGASWEMYSFLSAAVLPLMFPMLSISGLPACSIACFVATMTLFTGVVCLATSTLFKVTMVKALQKDRIRQYWIQASPQSWYQVPDQGFWIFLSLPTIWFLLSFGLLVTTIVFSVWERFSSVPVADISQFACRVEKISAFKYISLMMFLAGLLHLVFVFLRYRSLSA